MDKLIDLFTVVVLYNDHDIESCVYNIGFKNIEKYFQIELLKPTIILTYKRNSIVQCRPITSGGLRGSEESPISAGL